MRLLELHLDRFGCFTDRRLTFRPDAALTVIYGANEAGKSTALAAITDVLYGIEARSPFDFLHRYADMRLGATIAGQDGNPFAFRRRKGNQNTLLDAREAPLAEDALVAFLGSVDRTLFQDAFGLNRARLRAGAKQLIDGGGRVGETLLAAAPGLSSLIALRASLAAEADDLFPPKGRKVSSRPFWQACDSHAEARRRVRQESLQADTVRRAHTDRDEATEAVRLLRQEQRKLREEGSRLARLKAALPRLGHIDKLETAREGLGVLPDVPEDFPARCRTALDARRTIALDIQRLDREIAGAEAKLQALGVDDALLGQADAVDRLTDQRATVVKASEDLPKRQVELDRVRGELDELARRLGLADHSALLARRPPDTAVARARTLLTRRGRLRDQRSERREALAGVAAELDDLARRRAALGHVADPAPLRRQLDGLAGLPERLAARDELARALATRQADLDERLRRLVVPVASADELARLAVPDLASIDQAIERFDALERRRGDLDAERQRLTLAAASVERRIGELKADGDVPTAEALGLARRERDALWKGLRTRLLEPGIVASNDDMVTYEEAVARADDLADRRQADADRIAEDRALRSEQSELEDNLAANARARAEVDAQGLQAQADWSALWSPSQLTPARPREMRAWLQSVADIVRLRSELAAEQARYGEMDETLSSMTGRLAKLAQDLGVAISGPADLLNATVAAVSAMEKASANARLITEQREGCERRQHDLQTALGELDRQEAEWRSQWREAAGVIGLRQEADDEEAEAALNIWHAVPALEALMKDLEHRIARIEQDRLAFHEAAANLCAAIAADLGEADPAAASVALRARLIEARKGATSRADWHEALAGLEDKAEACRRDEQLNNSELAGLCAAAGVEDRDELGALASRIEQGARLADQLAGERRALLEAAEGFSETGLRAELAGCDPDSLTARLQELDDAEKALVDQLTTAIRTETTAVNELAGLEARAGAAAAAQDEQNALADVLGIIDTWSGLAAAERLLSAAIDVYRAQHQNPLLDRASTAFATATGGGFSGLALDYGEADSRRIVALRPDGARLALDALSEGTADQLFLALRIATIEDHAKRARPLPFVADDLFVTFDDTRTKAGLTLLAELGQTTQTIVFTHHQHVVEAARHVLGDRVEAIDLG